jgi:hypothetical protein
MRISEKESLRVSCGQSGMLLDWGLQKLLLCIKNIRTIFEKEIVTFSYNL